MSAVQRDKRRKYESARQLERQTSILHSARQLLDEEGYAGLTMRGLADRAGVAPATLYNLYGGKDGLIIAALEELLEEIRQAIPEGSIDRGIPTILAFGEAAARQITQTPSYAEAMARTLFNAAPGEKIVEVLLVRSTRFIEEQLHAARAAGQIDADVDVARVARTMQAQYWGLTLTWMVGQVALADLPNERLHADALTLLGIARGGMAIKLRNLLAST